MKAIDIKENARVEAQYEDSDDTIDIYSFTEEEMAILWSQLCKEQRELCANEGLKHGLVSAVRNAEEPKCK